MKQKQKGHGGFAVALFLIIASLVLIVGLSVYGFIVDRHAERLFTAPISTGYTPAATSAPSGLSNTQIANTQSNVVIIESQLANYFATYGYYPSTLTPQAFSTLTDNRGASPEAVIQHSLATPNGVRYIYNASPSGCSSTAKNCQNFTLRAETGNGKVIDNVTGPGRS